MNILFIIFVILFWSWFLWHFGFGRIIKFTYKLIKNRYFGKVYRYDDGKIRAKVRLIERVEY